MNKIKHLAIIMDGNQRWAKKNNKTKLDGYKKGLKKLEEFIEFSILNNIPILTIYALSQENYKRKSVNLIFQLIENFYKKFLDRLIKDKQVQVKIIGEKDTLSPKYKNIFIEIEKATINLKN